MATKVATVVIGGDSLDVYSLGELLTELKIDRHVLTAVTYAILTVLKSA